MKNEEKYMHIKGWNMDADPENEPTYPMKKYTGDDHRRLDYHRPPLQEETVEVLHSVERPSLPAVFGTIAPPKALSGMIRRMAFKQSESSLWHWLPLLMADRINAVEGIIADIGRGHIPNIVKERGWTAEWKYNRAKAWRRIGLATAISAGIIFWIVRKVTK